MAAPKVPNESRRTPPAKTTEARENQLINMAYDFAEAQFMAGTATSQLATHFLKMGSSREQLERVKMEYETELLKARSDQIGTAEDLNALAAKAYDALRGYQGLDADAD